MCKLVALTISRMTPTIAGKTMNASAAVLLIPLTVFFGASGDFISFFSGRALNTDTDTRSAGAGEGAMSRFRIRADDSSIFGWSDSVARASSWPTAFCSAFAVIVFAATTPVPRLGPAATELTAGSGFCRECVASFGTWPVFAVVALVALSADESPWLRRTEARTTRRTPPAGPGLMRFRHQEVRAGPKRVGAGFRIDDGHGQSCLVYRGTAGLF